MTLLRKQIALEVVEALGHRDALLLALHKGTETGRDVDVDTEDVVHLFLELRRMCRLAEDANLSLLQTFHKCLIAACSVRIKDILRVGIALAHGLADLVIAIGGTADEGRDLLVALAIEIIDTGKVGGIAYVHRIGKWLL